MKKVLYEGQRATQHPVHGIIRVGINEFKDETADALVKLGLVTFVTKAISSDGYENKSINHTSKKSKKKQLVFFT